MNSVNRTVHNGHTAVVEHNGTLYLGGIAASDLSLPLADQTRQIVEEIEHVLVGAGSSKASILQARVNLKNFGDKDEMNAVWHDWLDDVGLPARSTNGGLYMGEGVLIEIVISAAREK